MRTCFVEFCATAVSLIVGSCAFPSSSAPSCDDDLELCPHSSREATSVTCSCRCTVGVAREGSNVFEGRTAVCLPPALNARTASDEQRRALQSMEPRVFDQRVFRYCSSDVAGFARLAVKAHMLAHANMKVAACVVPVTCECGTAGTQLDSRVCHAGCAEVACSERNCGSVLRKGGKLDLTTCACSRSSTCGDSEPLDGDPALCADSLIPFP